MTMGPGKYDDLCTLVREKAGVPIGQVGGAIVIVMNGSKGDGFACQTDLLTMMHLPEFLEDMAKQIRLDVTQQKGK